ncbi:NEL-type E3 ubiquitin ligase domain-containing protein [Pandoraea pulmonicola]|uniref:Probable E3 ubiquitin-protein ligase ipaH7.8 n=1 Tax=Pandoraea pulmonicola TaxID=93221 RepID=A0AAJ4Z855_PANPU|nr:NEL-type E3 ubiquitin ligase domain-containing protein [Pandoraea pulmonicola]AJC23517.2 hypothetical protein RO07_20795 [Pandoraea pulmonicola]SUA88587.1 Probable E3 ubiquitin-protein ligase ipaH7.8 [Pandoraea pulmonicola]
MLTTSLSSFSPAAPAQLLSVPTSSSHHVEEAERLTFEYVGHGDDSGHEWRCAVLLAALAWVHHQSSRMGSDDMAPVRRDLKRHLARSCREGVDVEALVDTLASLCVATPQGHVSCDPSPVHVQLARDVLTTLETRVDAQALLNELIGSLPGERDEHDSGVDELYRSALCAWVAIGPLEWGGKEERATARDRIFNMADGKLNLHGLGLGHLPELPVGLASLDISYNDLTEVPVFSEGLATLDATGNKVTELRALPASLTTLNVSDNLLNKLPTLPAGLAVLDVSGNELVELPSLPASLTILDAHANELTELPALPASLKRLHVGNNRLTRLPAVHEGLIWLCVQRNQLPRLPTSVLSMSHDGQVFIEGNPFLSAHLQRLDATMSAPRYSGPQIHFSMAPADMGIAAVRPLVEAIRDWCGNDGQVQADQWHAHSEEAHAAEFSRFLDRLRESVNYNPDFKVAIASWLSKLARDGELRQLVFQVVQGASESCEDRVALAYNNLTKLSHAHAVARGEYDARLEEIIDRGHGAFRLDALEKIARRKAQVLPLVDEIEVYLAYQVQLRDRLKLPTDIANMRFFHVAGVTPQDLRGAEQEVRAREPLEFPQYFLVEWAPWRQVLARLDSEGTERARQKLHDMLPVYDQEVAAQLASLDLRDDPDGRAQVGVGVMKAQQLDVYKALTREFLRKRNEEALMDRIMGTVNR